MSNSEPAPALASQEARKEPPRIVIVDDDIGLAAGCWAEELHRRKVVNVVAKARNAQAGVAAATNLTPYPDVVLMDIHMPGADAFWACKEIVLLTGEDTKVVFFTGFPRDHYLDRCIDSKGSGMLSKHSATFEDLEDAILHV